MHSVLKCRYISQLPASDHRYMFMFCGRKDFFLITYCFEVTLKFALGKMQVLIILAFSVYSKCCSSIK